jgi:capsid protein
MEIDSFGIPVRQYDKFATMAQFRGKSWSWVDPQKEMNAAIMGLKNGVLSLQDVASNYGKDVEELMAQISRDKDVAAQFDIQYALEPYGATFNAVDAVVGDDDVE